MPNYGGRAEITQAVKLIAQDACQGESGDITEELIGGISLYGHLPKTLRDPDLIIRTSGELRLSTFALAAAYSELYFFHRCLVAWTLMRKPLKEVIVEFNRRNVDLEEYRKIMKKGLNKRTIRFRFGPSYLYPTLDITGGLWLRSDGNFSHA